MIAGNIVHKKGSIKRATALCLTVALLFSYAVLHLSAESVTAAERITAGLLGHEVAVEMGAFGLSPAALCALYAGVLEDDPALFYVAPRLSYAFRTDASGTVVTTVYPVYTMEGEALNAAQILYESTVASLLSEVNAVFDGHPHTEAEVALLIHELLADRYTYDLRSEGDAVITAYGLFAEGRGVCQAYAMAALALLRGAGLEADLVVSKDMDHAWVHLLADGEWYHMDVTRDDPIPSKDGEAMVTHTRLLRSDAGILAAGYRGFSCAGGHAAADARYETAGGGAVLGNFKAPLVPVSVGEGRPLVWVEITGTSTGGVPCGVQFGEDGATVFAQGDINGDGAVTPADLLLLRDPTWQAAWRTGWREETM